MLVVSRTISRKSFGFCLIRFDLFFFHFQDFPTLWVISSRPSPAGDRLPDIEHYANQSIDHAKDIDNFLTRKLSLHWLIIYLSSVSIIDNVSCSFTNQQCVKTNNKNQIFLIIAFCWIVLFLSTQSHYLKINQSEISILIAQSNLNLEQSITQRKSLKRSIFQKTNYRASFNSRKI